MLSSFKIRELLIETSKDRDIAYTLLRISCYLIDVCCLKGLSTQKVFHWIKQ